MDNDSAVEAYFCQKTNTRVLGMSQVTQEELKEMREIFGVERMPNPEMYPSSFEYLYKVYRLYKYDKNFSEWKENIHHKG